MKMSKPELAFKKSGRFCFNNWNDPYCIKLRHILSDLTDYFNKPYKGENILITATWYADINYVWIIDKVNQFKYLLTWYKSRGQTDCILFQGTVINLDEMKNLIKTIKKEVKK
jgi:hypothetical protein